jgi:hypothetical protein
MGLLAKRPSAAPTKGGIMSIILQDPVHLETPFRSPVRPAAPLDRRTASGEREASFELESPGGYRRTVTGKIAYLDDQAQTYMVRAPDGALIRVPLRDVKKTIESVA